MINFTTLNILGQHNGILDLKKGFHKAHKNMPVVSENLLRIAWKSTKIVLTTTWGYMKSIYLAFSNFTVKQAETNQKYLQKQLMVYNYFNALKY